MYQWRDEDMAEGGMAVMDPGIYVGEVEEVQETKTRNGDNMWSLKFKDVESGNHLCYDNLVFSPKGRGIALKKMSLLGIQRTDEGWWKIDSKEELIGLRAGLNLFVEKYKDRNDKEREKLSVDHHANETFGYEPANDDIPF